MDFRTANLARVGGGSIDLGSVIGRICDGAVMGPGV